MDLKKYNNEALIRFIQSHPTYSWDWDVLSHHPNLNLSVLKFFHDKPWNWSKVSGNDNFVWSWIRELPDKPWPWSRLDIHDLFSWRWIDEFPNKPWNWGMLSHLVTSPIKVSKFRDKPWDWLILTLSDNISLEFMMDHSDFPWVIGELFFRTINTETIHFLRKFQNSYTPHDWIDHTQHTVWSIIRVNMDLPWNFGAIRWKYGDLTYMDIKFLKQKWSELNHEAISAIADYHTFDLEWNLEGLSRNPSFTERDIKPGVKYNLNVVQIGIETSERWYAAQTIKRYWKRAITDPERKICRDVFLRYMSDTYK